MSKSAGCLCGGVRFEVTCEVTETGACHCAMCRKSSGGIFLGVQVAGDKVTFSTDETRAVYTSSPWAERGFCRQCGSTLYYRVTAPGEHHGTYHLALGAFDDPDGIVLTGEIYIDKKPDGYAFAGETNKMTEADVMKAFGIA